MGVKTYREQIWGTISASAAANGDHPYLFPTSVDLVIRYGLPYSLPRIYYLTIITTITITITMGPLVGLLI